MILIISKSSDQSTNDVIRLLINMNKSYLRINEDAQVEICINPFDRNESYFIVENAVLKFTDISTIWIRKGDFFKSMRSDQIDSLLTAEFILNEERVFYSVMADQLCDKQTLNSLDQVYFNKLKALQKAKIMGINVPESFILNSSNLLAKVTKCNRMITKPLFNIIDPKSKLSMLTRLLNEEDIKGLPTTFYPSLIQKYISSVYEIRAVFLLGELYSCVIVPRYKDNKLPDYRGSVYGDLGLEPIKMEDFIHKKICSLMKELKINFCSLDFIVDKNKVCYLIDINPFGQYGMVSVKYNNIIDLKIAKYLGNEK
jgi:glutathione synthase/RimK-type ligase-like ATP-grasp enzyme